MHSFVDILENSKNVKKKINTETEVYSASLQTPHKLKDYQGLIQTTVCPQIRKLKDMDKWLEKSKLL